MHTRVEAVFGTDGGRAELAFSLIAAEPGGEKRKE